MKFGFLFQSNERVLGLIKKKTKVLIFTSLAGFISTVILAVVFSFDISQTKLIPGIIVLGGIFTLNLLLLTRDNYKVAIRLIYLLPVSLYFFYIDNYYSIAEVNESLSGLLTFFYMTYIYLLLFSDSIFIFIFFYLESILTLGYFLVVNNLLSINYPIELKGNLFPVHPFIELTIMTALFSLIFYYLNSTISKNVMEKERMSNLVEESINQTNIGIIKLRVEKNNHGEPSGLKIIRTNNAFEKLFKISKQEMFNFDFREVFPVIFRDSFNWQDIYFHTHKSHFQVYIDHIDKWFSVYNIFPDENTIISCFFNISDLKYEAKKAQLRETRLTNLMGSLPDIFFIIENDGTYVDYVTNNQELMKLSQTDIIGKTIFEMGFSKPMTYQIYSSIQYVIENDNIETIEYGMELPNGKALIFEMRLARLNDTQVISIGRDITASKEFEKQLIEAKKKTEEASRLKSSFLENISHEIRTPMNAILGFSNMAMSDHYNEEEKKRFLEIVLKNGDYLMDVISNIIDISEVESGTVEYNPSEIKINDLFLNIYNKFLNHRVNTNNKIHLKLSLGNETPGFTVVNDSVLIIKIINQLVENAIKFTKEGTIIFGYEVHGEEIKIFTQDTGIGIQKKDFETIFDFFRQVDNKVSRTYSGTGAGLKIVKSLAEIIGSKIEFESQPGIGSTFYFSIPINKSA